MASTTAQSRTRIGFLRRVPKWLREIVLVGAIYGVYELTRGVTDSTFGVAKRNGWDILEWERAMGIAPEQLLTHALLSFTPLAVAAAYFYSTMHYIITPVVLLWMYRCHSGAYRPARTALAVSTMIGLAGFYLLPTAPPRLLKQAGVPDALFHVQHWGWWGGDGSVPDGLGSLTNQFAAMPSLHVGWALWCGFLIYRYATRTWVRALGVVYPLVTTFVVLATGNHYLLDAVAGALVMALGAGVTYGGRRLVRRVRNARRDDTATPDPTAASSTPAAATTSTTPTSSATPTVLPAALFRSWPADGIADAAADADADDVRPAGRRAVSAGAGPTSRR